MTGARPSTAYARRVLGEWLRFLSAETHTLRRRPELLYQQSANLPDTLAPSQAAPRYGKRRPWIRWINKDQAVARCLLTLPAVSSNLGDCAFFPDGRRVLTSSERGLAVFDLESGRELERFGAAWTLAVAISPDGQRLAWEESDGTLRLWDAAAMRELASSGGGTRRRGLKAGCRFSPEGSRLVAVTADNSLRTWDARDGASLALLSGHARDILGFAFTADGSRIATTSADGSLRLWRAADGARLAILSGHDGPVKGCCFSADGVLLASAGADGKVRLWDGRTGDPRGALTGHSAGVESCAFAPDGERLVSCGWEGELRLFDVARQRHLALLASLPDHARQFCDYLPGGRWIISSLGGVELYDAETGAQVGDAVEGRFRAFDPATGRLLTAFSNAGELKLWPLPTGPVASATRQVAFTRCRISPGGERIAATGTTVALFAGDSGEEVALLNGHQQSVRDLAFSPDGVLLVTCSNDGTLRTWDVASGTPRRVLRGHRNRVRSLAMAPDGSFVVSSSNDGTLKAWNPWTGDETAQLLDLPMMVDLCRIARNGQRIAAVTTDNVVHLLAAPAMTAVAALAGHQDVIDDLAFSCDGSLLASASLDHTVRLWETRSGKPLAVLRGHEHGARRCAFAPRGDLLASAGYGIVYLWDARSGKLLRELGGLTPRQVNALVWSPDGLLVAAGTPDGRILLWNAHAGTEAGEFVCDDWVADLAWHPAGAHLAAITDWGRLRLLRLESHAG